MAELFRYMQQDFVVPSAIPAIDVGNDSDLQKSLRGDISKRVPPDRVRGVASNFILKHFVSAVADPVHLGEKCLFFVSQLLALPTPGKTAIDQLVTKVFRSDTRKLIGSKPFLSDKALLDDALICIKITTGFDRVNAHTLVAVRQAIAFIEEFAAGKITDVTAKGIRATLRRPIRIPSEFVKLLTVIADTTQPLPTADPAVEPAARQRAALVVEQRNLKRAYEAIMGLPPDQFELESWSVKAERKTTRDAAGRSSGKEVSGGVESSSGSEAVNAAPSFLTVSKSAIEGLGGDVRKTLEKANIDIGGTTVSHVIASIKRQWQDVSRQLAPYQVPVPAKVFRVGVHFFAVQHDASETVPGTKEAL